MISLHVGCRRIGRMWSRAVCAARPGLSLKLACYDINVDGGDSECADRIGIEADQYSMYVNGIIKSFPSQVSGLRKQANSYRVGHKRLGSEEEGSRKKVPCFGVCLRQRWVSFFDLDKGRPSFSGDSARTVKPSQTFDIRCDGMQMRRCFATHTKPQYRDEHGAEFPSTKSSSVWWKSELNAWAHLIRQSCMVSPSLNIARLCALHSNRFSLTLILNSGTVLSSACFTVW